MITLDAKTLRNLQLIELDLLVELDRVCKKHGISYCLIAGTQLGAARHGGFIPWDDDADVAMLRADYERFRSVCAAELDPDKFYFQDHIACPGYRWGYGKLRRADTLFLREHQEHMPYRQGVFIDVFPLDAVPPSRFGRALANFECFCVRKVLWSPVGARACASGAARAWFGLLSRIPQQSAYRMLDRLIIRASRLDSPWVRILMFPTPNSEYAYRREWYERQSPAVFEGLEFPGVSDPDAYLTFKFGNWRELPPVSQRKTHPVTEVRLLEPEVRR